MKNFVSRFVSPLLHAGALALALGAAGNAAADATIHVTVDTSRFEAGSTGYLDFQFNPAMAGLPLASATMTALAGFGAGTFEHEGDVTGLPAGFLFQNTGALNELWVDAVLGGTFSFNLAISGDALPDMGTVFAMNILGLDWFPLTDLDGQNLLDIQWSLLDAGPGATITNNDPRIVTIGDVPATDVPEPASLLVLGLGLALLAVARRQRH